MVAEHGVTREQCNMLRILRGSYPKPFTCSSIAKRLVERTPDVTRLLVRFEQGSLVSRCRSADNLCVVEVSITEKGRRLLARLTEPRGDHIAWLTLHFPQKN